MCMKRKMAYIGLSFAASCFIASFLSPVLCVVAAGAVAAVSLPAALAIKRVRVYLLVICFSAAAAFLLNAAYSRFYVERVLSFSGKSVTVEGKITDFSYYSSDTMRIRVSGKINGGVTADISFYIPSCEVDYSDYVTVKGEVEEIKNTVNYSLKSYQNPLGVYLEGGDVSSVSVKLGGFSLKKYVLKYRDYLFETITDSLDGDVGGFLGAMLCGDKSELSGQTKLALYRSGLGHIFALSGTHVVIVTGLFASVLSVFLKNKRLQCLLTLVIIALFTVFAGAGVSVVRAALMAGLVHTAPLFRRRPDPLNSLGLAAFIILIISPAAVRSVSFILSFVGAFAVSVLSPYIMKRYEATQHKLLASIIIPNVIVSVAAIPVSVFVFREISIISPIANILMLPICDAALSLTAVIAAVGAVGFIAQPILFICSYLVKSVLVGAELLSSLPEAYVSTESHIVDILAIAASAVILAVLLKAGSLRSAAAFCSAATAAAFAAVFALLLIPTESKIYLLAKDSACAVVAVKDSSAVIIDVSGKNKLAPAIEGLLEDKSVSKADIFLCERAEYIKAYYLANLYTDIASVNRLDDTKVEFSELKLCVSCIDDKLILTADGEEYVIDSDEKTVSHDGGEMDYSDRLTEGVIFEVG